MDWVGSVHVLPSRNTAMNIGYSFATLIRAIDYIADAGAFTVACLWFVALRATTLHIVQTPAAV